MKTASEIIDWYRHYGNSDIFPPGFIMINAKVPPHLNPGDRIRIISPAGRVRDLKAFDIGFDLLKSWGYEVSIGKNALNSNKYFAGSDSERLDDLMEALSDPEIRCIICSRGGYGSGRLLNSIPWENIALNEPKIFIGFSDISALMLQFWSKAGWITYSGPQAAMALGGGALTQRSINHLRGVLNGAQKPMEWTDGAKIELNRIRGGSVKGALIPCNLSILGSLAGTPYLPDLSSCVVCIEDLNEPPYKIDRVLWQLRESKAFDNISGLILGRFTWEDSEISDEVSDIVLDLFSDFKFGVWNGFPYGHVNDRITPPVGMEIEISSDGIIR